jgi:hypothetical protein
LVIKPFAQEHKLKLPSNSRHYEKAYYEKNSETRKSANRKYYEAHKDRINELQKQYREENKYIRAIWNSYYHMLRRCYNPKHRQFHDYGGRGIKVCDRWLGKDGRKNFIADMGERPAGYTLERNDNNGNYTPENCRWASRREQQRNRRNNVIVEYQGRRMTLAEASELSGIRYDTLSERLKAGDTGERLFRQTPKMLKEILDKEESPVKWDHQHQAHQTPIKSVPLKLSKILTLLGLMRN